MSTAFEEGMKAFKQGISVTKNPYPIGSMNHAHWRTGWRTAESNNIP